MLKAYIFDKDRLPEKWETINNEISDLCNIYFIRKWFDSRINI